MNKFNMNLDYKRRDELLFSGYNEDDYCDGIKYFRCSYNILKNLVDENFANPEEFQNDSPKIKDFLESTKDYKDIVEFEGYTVSPERNDYGTYVDTIYAKIPVIDYDTVQFFVENFRHADEFSLDNNRLYYYLSAR